MPPMPAEAEAPPDLATPLTASAAASASRAMASSCATVGRSGSIRSRSGKSCASKAASANPAYLSSGAALLAHDFPDLDLIDPDLPTVAQLEAMARTAEQAGMAVKGVDKSGGASASAGIGGMVLVTSTMPP